MATTKLKEEKQHHREAFEIYYVMPQDKRSVRKVAKELGKSPSTVQLWSESFNWKERAEVRDGQIKRQFQELQTQNDETLVDIKASFHKILKAMIADAIKSIKSGKLKIESVNELLKVIELDLNLLGEEDRRAFNQMEDLNKAIQTSLQMFGGNSAANFTYDGKDRIEGDGDVGNPAD